MNKDLLDLYTDYLICSTEQTTATQLSRMLDGDVSHDQVTRFLSGQSFTSKDLWKLVKPTLRQVESDEGVLIFYDTIIEKQWTNENEIICYHFDHSKGRSVKGINLLNLIYHHNNISLPLSFQIVEKPISYLDEKTQTLKRKSIVTKNEILHQMFMQMIASAVKFKYVLFDSWFSSQETFELIRKKKHHFIGALKSNRLVALSAKDRRDGHFHKVREIALKNGECVRGWLKHLDFINASSTFFMVRFTLLSAI
ncbi:transposase [Acinetobacter sp. R933-2]|uniref:transposase n=1 Tax=Acinetobacter sp. R933-2 TaxID=2746728 RepID=UPI0025771084|nr:transposase [Acinetobacter sp. R933-2]MDM1249272.1 transposase [Acinetobacter sp. R933-2]